MRATTALVFEDGPLAGMTMTIVVDASLGAPDTMRIHASVYRDDDAPLWHASYAVPTDEAWNTDSEYAWARTKVTDFEGWTTGMGSLVGALPELPEPQPCPRCGGQGWTVEPGHACGGDESRCGSECPIPVQVQCGACNGGYVQPEPHAVDPAGRNHRASKYHGTCWCGQDHTTGECSELNVALYPELGELSESEVTPEMLDRFFAIDKSDAPADAAAALRKTLEQIVGRMSALITYAECDPSGTRDRILAAVAAEAKMTQRIIRTALGTQS